MIKHFFILSFLFLFSSTAQAEPQTYGAFDLHLESSKKAFAVEENLNIKIVISHSYPAALPGTFKVELFHDGIKWSENLINLEAILPGENDFTLKEFNIQPFNRDNSSVGNWRIRIFPITDEKKAQEIRITIHPQN
ncbi:MAG: hypothetical protein KBD53_01525 [Candidatus Omnitrophica bacterium]|nr:hypothetical protein [Candidatus Omnitrophota bacterium]